MIMNDGVGGATHVSDSPSLGGSTWLTKSVRLSLPGNHCDSGTVFHWMAVT